jgi:mannose/cellobiose epimerase-like protein (N-acyl-D-glucosamine 2-epimerase family)
VIETEDIKQRGVVAAIRARHWLDEAALSLWSSAGFDSESGMFQERLGFDGRPQADVPRRLMVQARQVSVFSRAALEDGFSVGAEIARIAGRTMIARYLRADGEPGWVFSIGADGEVAAHDRDLYTHAFVLYGMAWLLRLGPDALDALINEAVAETLQFLDDAFFDPVAGGYWDRLPRQGARRSQNPHMHLLEAFIELHDATADPALLERCRSLDRLARERFMSADRRMLREDFYHDWSVAPVEGAGRVEPGHLFEWACLLRRFEAVSGESRTAWVSPLIASSIEFGVGADTGRIVDEIGEDGQVLSRCSRSWPHAEGIKALAHEVLLGRAELQPILVAMAQRLLDVYCRETLAGGWVDHVDADDVAISQFMPASTFYHVYSGLKSLESVFGDSSRRRICLGRVKVGRWSEGG